MTPLLGVASLRHFQRHPWQALLAVAGIALGVAVVVSVDLALASARRAFALSVDAVAGRATHQITGGPAGLSDDLYRRLRIEAGARAAAPVVEGYLRAPAPGRTLRLLGVDPFAEAPFRTYASSATPDFDVGTLLAEPDRVLLAAATAGALGLAPGDTFEVRAGGTLRAVVLAGTLQPTDALARRAIEDLVIADIATAQEILGAIGRLDRIDLRLPDGAAGDSLAAAFRLLLPADAALRPVVARTTATAAMTRAFSLNLTALGLLALLFGTFLIYNSMTFGVVQRRALIGLLRAQGVTRGEILALILLEAAVLGGVATLLGIGLGRLLGGQLVGIVARTINDLYFTVTVTDVAFPATSVAKAIALGVGATIGAAIPAAREAANAAPRDALLRSALEVSTHTTARKAALLGTALLFGGGAALWLPGRSLAIGLTAIFLAIIGAALLAPLATVLVVRALRGPAGRAFGLTGRMAANGVAAALSRTGPAIAALTVAVAAGASIALMIASFRTSVERWLDVTLAADVYVSVPSTGANRREGELDADLLTRLAGLPGVAGVSTGFNVTVPAPDGEITVVVTSLYERHRQAFTFLAGDPARAWPAFDSGAVIVSEPLAWRRGLDVGDSLGLATPAGPRAFAVAGIVRDYATEFGIVFMDRATWDRHWPAAGVSSVSLFASPGTDADALLERARALDTGDQLVLVQGGAGLRAATLRVFDRTFAITAVLRVLALIVALIGVFAALMALQLERTRELGVLRAIGFTPAQIGRLIVSETGLIGFIAGILSLPVAAGLGWAMIHIVNRRAFGWTLDARVDAGTFVETVAFAVGAALLAGLYPALRMARTRPAAALREE